MNDSALDNSGNDRADEWDRESVIDVELERSFCIIVSMMRKDVQENTDEIERFSCDVRDLEYRADSLRNELCGGINALFLVLDEDGDFASAWRF